MFVASFPLAPLFALLNNMVELRSDAMNFIVNYRRRVAEQVSNIGIWFKILETLTKISVIVNSFVIAFTAEFIPRYDTCLGRFAPCNLSYMIIILVDAIK